MRNQLFISLLCWSDSYVNSPGDRHANKIVKLLLFLSQFCLNYSHNGVTFKDPDSSLVLSPFRCHICSSCARGNYFAVFDSSKWQTFPLRTCRPAPVCVKCHLSILPAVSQCQSHGGCWNLIVNRPLRRPLKQVKPFCFTAGRKLTLTTAAHHSHYHADDLNVLVLNELLLFSRLFWNFPAAFVAMIQIFASQNPRFNLKDMSNTSFFPIPLIAVVDPLAFD